MSTLMKNETKRDEMKCIEHWKAGKVQMENENWLYAISMYIEEQLFATLSLQRASILAYLAHLNTFLVFIKWLNDKII